MRADRACEKRLTELAERTARTGVPCFTGFLSPAEQAEAEICAKKAGVSLLTFGGAEGAERRVAVFFEEERPTEWPIFCLCVRWNRKYGVCGHRDLLGSLLGLNISREKLGDLFVGDGEAHVFVLRDMARYVEGSLMRVGSVPVTVERAEEIPALSGGQGSAIRATVASLRLDALLCVLWRLPRTRAAELVSSGRVQVDHQMELRPDRQLQAGAKISVRGLGRGILSEIGGKTKKDRISVTLLRY